MEKTAAQSRSSGDSMRLGLTTRIQMNSRESGPKAMSLLRPELGDERPARSVDKIAQNLDAVLLAAVAAARGLLAEVAVLLRLRLLRPLLLQTLLLPDDAVVPTRLLQ